MSISVDKWKLGCFVTLFFISSIGRAQSSVTSISFNEKEYLSPQGWYLKFLNGGYALFNLDTVQYRINKDTLHLIAIRTWIGEQRHQFKEDYLYLYTFINEGLQLQPLSLPYDSTKKRGNYCIERHSRT